MANIAAGGPFQCQPWGDRHAQILGEFRNYESAYAEVEADSKDEARAKADQLLEGGEIGGWEEDIPQVKIEELLEEDA